MMCKSLPLKMMTCNSKTAIIGSWGVVISREFVNCVNDHVGSYCQKENSLVTA